MSKMSTYKLPLLYWLPRVIDSNEIPGLEWMDETKTKFKVPWNAKDKSPTWEKEFELFEMWGNRPMSGRKQKKERKDLSQLKQNFRRILQQSPDFEELITENKLDHQSGNYRVYIMKSRVNWTLSPEDDELSSSARQLVSPAKQNSPSSDNLSEDSTLQVFEGPSSQSEAMECSQSFDANSNDCPAWNNDAMSLSPRPEVAQPLVCDPLVLRDNLINNVQNGPERFHYKFIVMYRGVLQCEFVYDMDHKSLKQHWPPHRQDCNGFRLLYGSDSDQFLRLAMAEKVYDDFNLPSVDLRSR